MIRLLSFFALVMLLFYTGGAKVEFFLFQSGSASVSWRLIYLAIGIVELALGLLLLGTVGSMQTFFFRFCAVLFACFVLFHLFINDGAVKNCGCFGEGIYDRTLMIGGCAFLSFGSFLLSGSLEKVTNNVLTSVSIFLGLLCFFSAFQSTSNGNKILSFCDYIGFSIPVEGLVDQEIASDSKRVTILNSSCQKCAKWLTRQSIEVPQGIEIGSKYLIAIHDSEGRVESCKRLETGGWEGILIETPVQIGIRSGYIVSCNPTTELVQFFDTIY